MPHRATVFAALATLALVAGGCAQEAEDPGPSLDDRVAEVAAARAALADPARDLGGQAALVERTVAALRLGEEADPRARLQRVDEFEGDALADLAGAVALARGLEVGGDGADARAVRAAWERGASAGENLVATATADAAVVRRLAEAEVALEGLVARWDEPGSRNQQLDRLAEVAATAEALADDLADGGEGDSMRAAEPPGCRAAPRRVDAAGVVAERSRELRELVAAFRGDEFDRVRREYAQDPFGLGARFADLDGEDAGCWEERGATALAAREVAGALGALEAALNPPDLSARS